MSSALLQADSFVITLDSLVTTVDSVLAGVGLPLKIKAVARDSRYSEAFRVVEDYREAGVRIRVEAGAQDIGAVEFRGVGVTDRGGGTATLDGAGWRAGVRIVEVRSTRPLDAFSVLVAGPGTETAGMSGRLGFFAQPLEKVYSRSYTARSCWTGTWANS